MRTLVFHLLFVFSCCVGHAQLADSAYMHRKNDTSLSYNKYFSESHTNFSLYAGYNQSDYGFAEVGVGINKDGRVGYHSSAAAAFISTEVKVDRNLMIGPKIGCWISGGVGGMALGASTIYYTDFKGATLRARPEIGFGMGIFKLTYGYNFAITNKNFTGINTHVASLGLMIKLKQLHAEKTIDTSWPRRRIMFRDTTKVIGIDTVVTKTSVLFLAGIGGWRYGMAEAGIALYIRENGDYADEPGILYMGCEYLQSSNPVYGFKLSTYVYSKKDFGLCGGAPIIYYTDFQSNSWSLRFSGGIHYRAAMLLCGYNLFFSKYRYSEIARGNVSLIIGLPFAKLKNEYTYIKKYEGDNW